MDRASLRKGGVVAGTAWIAALGEEVRYGSSDLCSADRRGGLFFFVLPARVDTRETNCREDRGQQGVQRHLHVRGQGRIAVSLSFDHSDS